MRPRPIEDLGAGGALSPLAVMESVLSLATGDGEQSIISEAAAWKSHGRPFGASRLDML